MESVSARDHILGMVGVRQWYSKCILPNAAETPKDFFCEAKAIENVSTALRPKLVDVLPLVSAIPAGLDDIPSISKPKLVEDAELDRDQNVVKVGESKVKPQVKVVPNLTVSAVSIENITILFEQTDTGNENIEKTLLEAIANVITGKASAIHQKDMVLTWPVFESGAFKEELSVYFDLVVKRWLETQYWSECDYVFYFGDHLSSLESVLLDIRAEQNLEYKVVSCNASLAQILSSPIKKKNLWELFSRIGVVDG